MAAAVGDSSAGGVAPFAVTKLDRATATASCGCLLCLRPWTTPNPIISKRQFKPMLPRKSARASFCSPCGSNVYTNHPMDSCASLLAKITNDEFTQEAYDESLLGYVAGMNGTGPRAKRRKRKEESDADEDEHKNGNSHSKMQITRDRGLTLCKNLGIFWEEHDWNAATKDPKRPAYKEALCHKHELMLLPAGDARLRGVTRDERFGKPIGTGTITEDLRRRMKLVHEFSDKADGCDPKQMWAQALKRKISSVGSVEVGTEEAPAKAQTVKLFVTKKAADPSDGCLSAFDDLFCASAERISTPKQASASPSSAAHPAAPAQARDLVKRHLNKSENVVLMAKQLLREAAGIDAAAISRQQVDDRLQAVKKRLCPELVETYTAKKPADIEDDADTVGVEVLSNLREVERHLTLLHTLATLRQGEGSTPSSIMIAIQQCREGGVQLHKSIDAWVVSAQLDNLAWDAEQYYILLKPDSEEPLPDGADDTQHSIRCLRDAPTVQEAVQRKSIVNKLGALMTPAGNKANVLKFAKQVLLVKVIDDDFRRELEELVGMAEPSELDRKQLKKVLASKRKHLGVLLLAKATGIEIEAEAANALDTLVADAQLTADVIDGADTVDALGAPELTEKGNVKKWVAVKMIAAAERKLDGGSARFKQDNNVAIAKVRDYVVSVRNQIHSFATSTLDFAPVVGPCAALLKAGRVGHGSPDIPWDSTREAAVSQLKEGVDKLAQISPPDDPRLRDLKAIQERVQALMLGLALQFTECIEGSIDFVGPCFAKFQGVVFQDDAKAPNLQKYESVANLVELKQSVHDVVIRQAKARIVKDAAFVAAAFRFFNGSPMDIDLSKADVRSSWSDIPDPADLNRDFASLAAWLPARALDCEVPLAMAGEGKKKMVLQVKLCDVLVMPAMSVAVKAAFPSTSWGATVGDVEAAAKVPAEIESYFAAAAAVGLLIDQLRERSAEASFFDVMPQLLASLQRGVAASIECALKAMVRHAVQEMSGWTELRDGAEGIGDLKYVSKEKLEDEAFQQTALTAVQSEIATRIYTQYKHLKVVVEQTRAIVAAARAHRREEASDAVATFDADAEQWLKQAKGTVDCLVAVQVVLSPKSDQDFANLPSRCASALNVVTDTPEALKDMLREFANGGHKAPAAV
eukprot:TRINITY_DN7798_c0_g1_i2.p1 TRINITY_DN7798_c0_g1~~TRINITY_DN7798_c0_g1_i2.p1  ORF type:complete len:1149 (-),score=261.51 TRINITY_DN7798_c0_g1_i2:140-3586(-)